MNLTRYGFDCCVGAFFEISTQDARRILPAHLQPVEIQHERSVMAVLAFRFTESEVGQYDELVMAVITPPLVEAGKPLPKAAFFPFMVATSTDASRAHAIERWRLPHHMAALDFEFIQSDGAMQVVVRDGGDPVVELTVTEHDFAPALNPYHCFTSGASVGGEGNFKVNIFMDAPHSEHEEEEGELILHEHPMTSMLTLEEVASYPFREEWYQAGVQTFEELETL
ncbi:MAG TPA: acetoacetate decarboxylase family protein [Longimicrobiales bacterium]|nr:acetoacetate decarboxylase family protein [Longimicrobiales bacterium]